MLVKEQQTLERRIVKSVEAISRGLDLMVGIQLELISHRSKFITQITAYRTEYKEAGLDDLIMAIIADNAIPPEEICLAFDLNLTTLRERVARIKRDRGELAAQ